MKKGRKTHQISPARYEEDDDSGPVAGGSMDGYFIPKSDPPEVPDDDDVEWRIDCYHEYTQVALFCVSPHRFARSTKLDTRVIP